MSALADLVRVLKVLRPDGADADRAAELIGLRWTRMARMPLPRRQSEAAEDEEEEPPGPTGPAPPREETPLPISVEWRDAPPAVRAVWAAEPVAAEDLRYRRATIPLEPILQPLSTRTILSALVATPVAGAPDIDALIAAIAVREPIRRVRHLLALTVRRGVQVLVDKSPSMAPFRRDQIHLVTQLRRVIGESRVSAIDFIECPSRGAGAGPINRWKSYAAPPPRTPVLLLSDLGIGREDYAGATIAEWLAFAHDVREAGCSLLALVPYARRRWPPVLETSMALAQWDRSLTARAARRAAGRGNTR